MNKQPEITEKTRQGFINAFLELNAKKPIEKITIKEITGITGNNRCTFYHYFSDVYEVLEKIEEELIKDVEQIVKENYDDARIDQMIVNAFMELYQRKEEKLKIVLSPQNRYHFFESLKNQLVPVFSHIFSNGENSVKKEYILELFFSGMLSILSRWIMNQDEIPLEELTQVTESFFSSWLLKKLEE